VLPMTQIIKVPTTDVYLEVRESVCEMGILRGEGVGDPGHRLERVVKVAVKSIAGLGSPHSRAIGENEYAIEVSMGSKG